MGKENENQGQGQGTGTGEEGITAPGETVVETPPEIDNSTLKKHPWVQEMATTIAALKKEKEDRQAADAQAQKDAELRQLEEKGNYEAALKLEKQERENERALHAQELQQRDLKTALYKEKFTHDVFVDGAIARYNPESHGTPQEYVASLVSDESNNIFRTAEGGTPPPPSPPGSISVTGRKLTKDQLTQMERSPDREVRLKAIEYKRHQYDQGTEL